MVSKCLIVTALFFIIAGCVRPDGDEPAQPRAERSSASFDYTLVDRAGRAVASARVGEGAGGLRIDVSARSMAPGKYGLHVHAVGRCDAPDFTSAGAHWNPTAQQHGRDNPAGAHLGDLPNLAIGADGQGRVGFTLAGASFTTGANPMFDADGTTMLIHAQPDDYRTDPSGNSGARIACGVLARARSAPQRGVRVPRH